MISLLLDTATDHGLAALFSKDLLIKKIEFQAGFNGNKSLLEAISKLEVDVSNLEYIAVGVGPGSYTGIRVAASFAKGLSAAKNIPLIGISSLKGYVPEEGFEGGFISAIDAKIGGVYIVEGKCTGGKIEFMGDEKLITLDEFVKSLEKANFLVTPDVKPLLKRLEKLPEHLSVIERRPSAELLGKLAFDAFCKGFAVKDGRLELHYLRKTQAELEKQTSF